METRNWSFKITPLRVILLGMTGLLLVLALFRLAMGLGVATNLNDRWPWGLWIGVDLTAVALAGAGYSMAVLVHVLNIEKFKPVARRALLFSLVTYIFVLGVLILEIGRPDNFWRPFVSWGYHSPMFEVVICISAYTLIQVLEFAEVATEKVGTKWHNIIKKMMPVVVILGALLPFGHQASLGALYLIVPSKLHDLWYTWWLPWFFLITSFYVGPAIVALESIWSKKIYGKSVDSKILQGLIKISGGIMVAYLILKIYDLINRGVFSQVFAGGLEGNMFLLEIGLGVILPIIICFSPWGKTRTGITTFSILAAAGIVLNRINVVFTGMYNSLGSGYTPSFIEWGITFGMLALVILVYLFVVENFAIYGFKEKEDVALLKKQGKHQVNI